jgi:hypothetical protein
MANQDIEREPIKDQAWWAKQKTADLTGYCLCKRCGSFPGADGYTLCTRCGKLAILVPIRESAAGKTYGGDIHQVCANHHTTTSFAFSGGYEVRVVGNLTCPNCGRKMQATDVEVIQPVVRMICGDCHRDVLTIRPPQ